MPDTDLSVLVDVGPRDETGQPLPPNIDAVVLKAPTSETDPMHVSIPSFDDNSHRFGPCPWGPVRATLPAVGDRCLVTFSNLHTPWVTCWWPAGQGY